MLVKVNSVDIIKKKVKVIQLDIDDYGSVIPLKELELNILADNESVIQTLKMFRMLLFLPRIRLRIIDNSLS